MKLISWNVNGLRACIQKGFLEFFQQADADFFCLQETKLSEGQLTLSLPGYHQYWNYAEKKGYSGTAIFTKHQPLSVSYGIGVEELDNEGRVITLEYPEFFLVNCYTPNAQRGLARLDHRMKWDEAYRSYVAGLDAQKPTILCGDLNVAHQEIDLKNPGSNRGNAGFSDEERESFSKTLALGFTDTFRYLHPDATGAYTWWSYMFHARENNAGWRIDYFLTSDRIREKIYSTPIYSNIFGSDHCPVGLELDISCNGSVWIESKAGKPEAILPEKKLAKNAAKVLLAALAIAIFAGLGSYAVKLFSPSAEEYITFHSYDRALTQIIFNFHGIEYYKGELVDGNISWPLFSVYQTSLPPQLADLENFWLRLDLTEKALQEYNDQWMLTVSTDHSLTVGTMHSLEDTTDLLLLSYYDGENPANIQGWFLFGRIPGETTLNFTLDTGSGKIKFSKSVTESVSIPSTAQAQKLTTKELVNNIISDEYLQQQLTSGSVLEDVDALYLDTLKTNGSLIELENRADAIKHLLAAMETEAKDCQRVAHFLLSNGFYTEKMNYEQKDLFLRLEDRLFALNAEQLSEMKTKDILYYTLDYEDILDKLSTSGILLPNAFQNLLDKYPSLAELDQREDLVEELLSAQPRKVLQSRAIEILLKRYQSTMTPKQHAHFILGMFPAYTPLTDPVLFNFQVPLETKTTEELVHMLLLDSGLGLCLVYTDNQETRDYIYDYSAVDAYEYGYILGRKDLIDTMFQMASKDCNSTTDLEKQFIKSFLGLTKIQERMNAEQKAIYEKDYSEFIIVAFSPSLY